MKLAILISLLLFAADDSIRMIPVSAGTFGMGADSTPIAKDLLDAPGHVMSLRPAAGDFDEKPAHDVRITKSFRMSEYEVTIEQFRQFHAGYTGNPAFAPYAAGVSWY